MRFLLCSILQQAAPSPHGYVLRSGRMSAEGAECTVKVYSADSDLSAEDIAHELSILK